VRPLAARLVLGLVALVLLGWGLGALWTSLAGSSELHLMRSIVSDRTAALTSAARILTWPGSLWVLIPLALLSCALLARAGFLREALIVGLGLLGGIIISSVLKPLVDRPRPPVEHLQAVSGPSFPSGHATQASAFWISLALALRTVPMRRGALAAATVAAVVLVVVVSLTRVYLGVHYPADVIAGVLLGGAWAVYVRSCVWRAGWPST
jgi:undecaprenyl-diphosphatase